MKRLALVALVAVLAACGSDNNGPTDKFTGRWTGFSQQNGDTANFVFNATQNGSGVVGTGILFSGPDTESMTFNGTSTPPTLNLTVVITGSPQAIAYSATYVNGDSLIGTLSAGGQSLGLALGKH